MQVIELLTQKFKASFVRPNLVAGGLLAIVGLTALAAWSAESESTTQTALASKYVRAAFEAELTGAKTERDAALSRALSLDPDHAVARSLLGQVFYRGKWQDVEAMSNEHRSDKVIADYHRMRLAMQGSAAGHEKLARYCGKHGLTSRAEFHWRMLLAFDPTHSAAARKLGLVRFHKRWVRPEWAKNAEDFLAKEKVWRELVEAWAEEAGDESTAESGLKALRNVFDPYALPALETAVWQNDEAIAAAALESILAMDYPEATHSLARVAIQSNYPSVREQAANALKGRSQLVYVPLLLARLTTPIRVNGRWNLLNDGMIYSISLETEGSNAQYAHTIYGSSGSGLFSNADRAARVDFRGLEARANTFRIQAAQANQIGLARNRRIFAVLGRATGAQVEDRSQAWWSWWAQQNDLYEPEVKPRVDSYELRDLRTVPGMDMPGNCECFLPGTKIWTDAGKRPIEQLRPGDRVLTCDPEKGSVTYQTVMGTTVRPSSGTTRLRLEGEDLVSTNGHPFWVIGKGWLQARQVKAGDRLRGVRGVVRVEAVEGGPDANVHNLIVDQVSNYFVGERGVLAHDGTLQRPTRNLIPGFAGSKPQAD